jgi:hypothetical protein
MAIADHVSKKYRVILVVVGSALVGISLLIVANDTLVTFLGLLGFVLFAVGCVLLLVNKLRARWNQQWYTKHSSSHYTNNTTRKKISKGIIILAAVVLWAWLHYSPIQFSTLKNAYFSQGYFGINNFVIRGGNTFTLADADLIVVSELKVPWSAGGIPMHSANPERNDYRLEEPEKIAQVINFLSGMYLQRNLIWQTERRADTLPWRDSFTSDIPHTYIYWVIINASERGPNFFEIRTDLNIPYIILLAPFRAPGISTHRTYRVLMSQEEFLEFHNLLATL